MKKYAIIIVENDPDERFFMNEGFAQTDLFTILAQVENGDELFKWLGCHPGLMPDLILSDLNMPGKNGYDIIAFFRSHPVYNAVPVIITSTSATPSIIQKCRSAGAADYLVKPETFIEYAGFSEMLYNKLSTTMA